MNMSKNDDVLKVAFIDFWPEWSSENFITPILDQYFNVVIDIKNPDVVFYSIFGHDHTKYKCKKILYTAENLRYNYNSAIRKNITQAIESADYTISFDPQTDTNYRLPLWQVFILRNPAYLDLLSKRVIHNSFERFASFTVSNPSNFMRNGMYTKLSSYKRVNSYGRYLTNDMGLQIASKDTYWREAKDTFFKEHTHKFAITYENSVYPYYCTEKLMDAFLSGSMPLYSGDPKVKEDWNEKAFINVNDYSSNIMNVIRKMDSDYEVFESKYHQPVFTDNQLKRHIDNISGFEAWIVDKIKK